LLSGRRKMKAWKGAKKVVVKGEGRRGRRNMKRGKDWGQRRKSIGVRPH